MSIIQLHHAYQHHMNNQSYQSSANHSHINQNEVINTINQQPESDLGDFTLDQDGWDNLISYLEGLDVFRRIRYADEINKLNGFEVVGEALIREWKMEAGGLTIEKSKWNSYKGNRKNQNSFVDSRLKKQSVKKERENNKMSDIQKGIINIKTKSMRLKVDCTKGYMKSYIKLLSK